MRERNHNLRRMSHRSDQAKGHEWSTSWKDLEIVRDWMRRVDGFYLTYLYSDLYPLESN